MSNDEHATTLQTELNRLLAQMPAAAGSAPLLLTSRRNEAGYGDPDCPHCHGWGQLKFEHLPDDHPTGNTIPVYAPNFPLPNITRVGWCPCYLARNKHNQAAHLLDISGLKPLRGKTFASFLPDGIASQSDQRLRLRQVFDTCQAFAEHADGRWLLLRGNTGTGKTHLAAAIANAALDRGVPVLFLVVPDLLDYLRAAFAPSVPESYAERFDEVCNAPLLVLDDLGTESATSWAIEKLYQLLNHRYNACLPTVITTNKPFVTLDHRIASRLSDTALCTLLEVDRLPDFRTGIGVNPPPSFLPLLGDFTFATFKQRPELMDEQAESFAECLRAAQTFAAHPEGWLVLIGAPGTGKTHLAAATATALSARYPLSAYVMGQEILRLFRPTATTADARLQKQGQAEQMLEAITQAAFAVIEDVPDLQGYAPWERERFLEVVHARYIAKLPTVWTTSVAAEQLDQRILSRFADKRVSQMYVMRFTSFTLKGQR